MEIDRRNQRITARRELLHLQTQENKLREAARKEKTNTLKSDLEKRIPPKVYNGVVSAFSKGFSLVFKQGRRLIEMTYDKQAIRERHQNQDSSVRQGNGRRELRQMKKSVNRSNSRNLTATTAEGIALGIFGVGLPDIVLFLSTLLKGIYETSLNYGFEYASAQEQYLILAMMRAALAKGSAWEKANAEVDALLSDIPTVTEQMLKESIQKTASVFAVDMLLLKFIQGMPVVGFLGGAANPVYYHKVMRYVHLKYKKRYLLKQL